MLIWVCALHCEAKPVIDFYRLKKSHAETAFDLYQGDKMACIISGTGKIASAAATAWAAAKFNDEPVVWINLGIAGAAEHPVGSIFLVTQVIDPDSGQNYYPVTVTSSSLDTISCISLNQPSLDYHPRHLFDMEASGFFDSALRFSTAEL